MSPKLFTLPFAISSSRHFRDAILYPRNKRITPRGEPTAKKFRTGNNKAGDFLSIAMEDACKSSSMESVRASLVRGCSGCVLKISNARRD